LNYRANDIEAATTAKFKVEQKQRDEAKVRKDENSSWANNVIELFKNVIIIIF
jgi:D-ribose pyranose/furanose isomerase RbsD